MEHNVAIIRVSKKAILDWLKFEDGEIHSVRINPEKWNGTDIEFVIEHPDLPATYDGAVMLMIDPVYKFWKRGRFQKILRIEPPKRVKVDGHNET